MTSGPAIVTLGPRGAALARRLRDRLPDSEIHAPTCADCPADVRFTKAAAHIADLFAAGRPVVGLCASGILIRAVASLLDDKRHEPPVVAVAEDGSAVVPLLGGHHGANRLARAIAAELGVVAALTTAGDLRLGIALDEPPPGWVLDCPEHAKSFMAKLLEGSAVRLTVEVGDADWLARAPLPFADDAALELAVTHRELASRSDRLVYHPPVLALGVGRGSGRAGRVPAGGGRHLPGPARPRPCQRRRGRLARPEGRRARRPCPGRRPRRARRGSSPTARLLEETPRLANPSEIVFRETGCWGVAEGAALAAVGVAGRLAVPKQKGDRVTCALALAPGDLDASAIGRPRGTLAIVGLGPGGPAWRTAEAQRLLGDGAGTGRLRPLSRPDWAGISRPSSATSSRSVPRWSAAASPWSAPPRAVRWPWSAPATPASTPWRRSCSSCWMGGRIAPGRGWRSR